MLAGFISLSIGTFLSIMYFIVIPIIPDKKHPSIVTPINIPVFAFSFILNNVAIATPIDKPASEPTQASNIILGKLVPKSTFKTNIVYMNNIAIPN